MITLGSYGLLLCVYLECTGSCLTGLLIYWHVGQGRLQSIGLEIVGRLSCCISCGPFDMSINSREFEGLKRFTTELNKLLLCSLYDWMAILPGHPSAHLLEFFRLL